MSWGVSAGNSRMALEGVLGLGKSSSAMSSWGMALAGLGVTPLGLGMSLGMTIGMSLEGCQWSRRCLWEVAQIFGTFVGGLSLWASSGARLGRCLCGVPCNVAFGDVFGDLSLGHVFERILLGCLCT